MPRQHAFAQVDVFSPAAYLGNPVAVILDAEDLDDQDMGAYRVSQGRRLGRAGDVTITADPDGTIWVGGNTNTLFHGTAFAH